MSHFAKVEDGLVGLALDRRRNYWSQLWQR